MQKRLEGLSATTPAAPVSLHGLRRVICLLCPYCGNGLVSRTVTNGITMGGHTTTMGDQHWHHTAAPAPMRAHACPAKQHAPEHTRMPNWSVYLEGSKRDTDTLECSGLFCYVCSSVLLG
jgi:hypothetical protein